MKTTKKEINGIMFEFVNEKREAREYKTLEQAYKTASTAKRNAYKMWQQRCMDLNGWGFGITGHNCHKFTLEFKFDYEDITYLAVITARHNYLYKYKRP